MPLTVKSINGDSAFLLTFSPPTAPLSSLPRFPGSFTILIDPWLVGPATILSSIFSISEQTTKPCISSLEHLEHEPDVILISQDKPDHCHEQTLRQLSPGCASKILAIPSAARKIRSWKHFRSDMVQSLPRYAEGQSESVHRIVVPPTSPVGTCGEVTLTWMPAKRDVSALHHAIGITYRPPGNESFLSPPNSPMSFKTASCSPGTSFSNNRESTLSVIYSPHGVSYGIIRPYAATHLVTEAALPLTALIHSFDCVENPWYLGGNISAGLPGGIIIAKNLYARSWIGAHDAHKKTSGLSVKRTKIGRYADHEVKKMLSTEDKDNSKDAVSTNLIALEAGEEHRIR
ncbi:hypothetical protein DM02DRAFT_513377 [Periconia macrospinosa]|uniref:Metallo-beta-lactamase domain-containing protein n=1 Tax=Periconia macrospinosa TaxID=97972 RepID=A0A2V1E9K9_9PLEO|nr:hypothetical protein DM02DRAFT_513377 [Periconia macrospinosa]